MTVAIDNRIPRYLHKFSHLRTERTSGWTAATQGQAPHKPILLLSVLDLFAQGRITTNLIEITHELGELFAPALPQPALAPTSWWAVSGLALVDALHWGMDSVF